MMNPKDKILLMMKQGRFEILEVRTNMVISLHRLYVSNLQELCRGSVLIARSVPARFVDFGLFQVVDYGVI